MQRPDEIIELFSFIEKNYDVSKFSYQGINFWPLIRKDIGFHLSLNSPSYQYKYSIKKTTFTDHLKFPLRIIKLFLLKKKFQTSYHPILTEAAICTYPDSLFIDHIGNKTYSRYIDPYYEVLKDHFGKITRFGFLTSGEKPKDTFIPIRYLNLDSFLNYYSLKQFLYKAKDDSELTKISKVFSEVNELVYSKFKIKPLYSGMITGFDEVIKYKEFFDQFFLASKVKVIFLECFYDTLKMALCASAANKKIKVVEIQHGGAEDNVYLPYSNKSVNYIILPPYFWCWSISDKILVQKHNGEDFNYLKPFVGGNMWLKKFRLNEMELPSEHASFLKALNAKKKVIVLICLQPSFYIDDIFIRVIENYPDMFFLIRYHPLTSTAERKEVNSKLRNYQNIEIEFSSKIHLYALFNCVNFQMTHSSTTAMEALAFKLPTIICSKFGYDYYKEQIKDNVIYFADSIGAIDQIFAEKKKLDFEKMEVYSIKSDPAETIKNLSAVCAV